MATGLATTGLGFVTSAGRPVHRRTRRVVDGLGATIGSIRRTAADLLLSTVPGLTGAILDQLDLTALVRERIDMDALVAEIDVVAIARDVIDEIDLPQIVRESTGAMASETVRGVRIRTVDADERVTRAVDRLLRRQTADATDHGG